MRRSVVLTGLSAALVAAGACGGPRTSPNGGPAAVVLPGPAGAQPATLPIPRAPYAVVPAELGDADVLGRLRHRAVVRHWGNAWLRRESTPIGRPNPEAIRTSDEVAVLEEGAARIRIAVEDDGARFAAWIAREDLAPTVLAPIELVDHAGAPGAVSVTSGISLALGDVDGGRRKVTVIDDQLELEAWAPVAAVGSVWTLPPGAPPPASLRPREIAPWTATRDGRPLVRISPRATILAAADPRARTLATLHATAVIGQLVATGPAFLEVEVERPHLRLRGFVTTGAARVVAGDWLTHGSGSGHGFGMSHAAHHQVPAGTCLYDQPSGDVIGVTLVDQDRLGRVVDEDGWAVIYVDSPWGVIPLAARDLVPATERGAGAGSGATAPAWESCSAPTHR